MKAFHYIACDSLKYIKEATESAKGFRNKTTDSYFILYTNFEYQSKYFDKIVSIPNLIPNGATSKNWTEGQFYFENKINYLANTEFELNAYCDGDIKPLVNVDPIFNLLEKFDIAVAHDSCRSSQWSDKLNIPLCFPDLNCGLIFYKKSTTVDFFKQWQVNYGLYPQPHDQPSFRKSVWDSNIRMAVLPPEFNIRPKQFHWQQNDSIIHGRGPGFLPEISTYDKDSIPYL